jgi:chromosome segregation ATPase
MAQPILKRRLNPLLLISTVAALSLLAGVAVLAQDQMADVQQERSNVEQQLQDALSEAERLRAEIGNKTARIRQMNGNISQLSEKLNRTESELENKTERINELESQLDEQRQALNQSETIQEMNESFSFVCAVIQTDDPSMRDECNEWGHQVTIDDEG